MKLDCVKASDYGLGDGWVIVNMQNGGVVAHDVDSNCGFAWMMAAESMANAIEDIQRTIYGLSPQKFHD